MTARHCLVTGASRGLGAALARAFWRRGYSLVLVARNESNLLETKQSLEQRAGQQVVCIGADLTDIGSVPAIIKQVQRDVPRIDVLLNNAAIQGPIGPLWQNDWAAWVNALRVDLVAVVELCAALTPSMIASGGGSIINISGGGATGPRPNFTAYATAKAGLVRFSETLAGELRNHGIRVNCVAPGAMQTSMLAEVIEKGADGAGERELASAREVLQSGGASMERVTELCLFLASDSAKGITGKLISAVWDPWPELPRHCDELMSSDIYTLRRIVPKDRDKPWGNDL
jgi:short-subunit dehydrogenase